MSRRSAAPDDMGWLSRVVESGALEVVLAGLLAVLTILLDAATSQPWQPLALDLTACVLAALTPRWPRAAGIALGVVLSVYVFIPAPWGTLGEYSLLIPILGTGMRGHRRTRLVMTAFYFVILCAEAVTDTPGGRSPVIGWIAWAVLFAVLWLIGNVFFATTQALHKAKQAELILQRQVLARDLHDTVARSLTRVTMAAERARLRGHASDAELATIADAASRGNEELRWAMAILRDPLETTRLGTAADTPLERALVEAEADLRRHGFQAAVSIEGPIEQLSREQADALGAVTGEAAGNMVKHAEPDTACAIIVDVDQTAVRMVFVNRPRTDPRQDRRFASMGLNNIRERLEAIGGQFAVDDDPDQWTIHVNVPRTAQPAGAGGLT